MFGNNWSSEWFQKWYVNMGKTGIHQLPVTLILPSVCCSFIQQHPVSWLKSRESETLSFSPQTHTSERACRNQTLITAPATAQKPFWGNLHIHKPPLWWAGKGFIQWEHTRPWGADVHMWTLLLTFTAHTLSNTLHFCTHSCIYEAFNRLNLLHVCPHSLL